MNRSEILHTIKQLAQSQGYYSRLLNNINELDNDQQDELFSYLEEQKFNDPLDLVLFFEC